jgi:hypothetical protein
MCPARGGVASSVLLSSRRLVAVSTHVGTHRAIHVWWFAADRFRCREGFRLPPPDRFRFQEGCPGSAAFCLWVQHFDSGAVLTG